MELDFGSIRFCGRYKEVQQLNVVLDQVRGECLPGNPGTNHNNHNNNRSSPTTQHHGSSSSSRPHTGHHHRSDGSVVSQNSSCSIKPCHKMVAIEGPGGTGKSMLVEHFLESIAQKQRLFRPSPAMMETNSHHHQSHHHHLHQPDANTGGGSSGGGAGGPLILVGRGKFEESSTMPFASFAECIGSLLDDLMSIDPDWSDTLTADTRRELKSLSSIVPNLRRAMLSSNHRGDEEAASTVGSGSDSSGSQSGRQWVRFLVCLLGCMCVCVCARVRLVWVCECVFMFLFCVGTRLACGCRGCITIAPRD
jgi:hypothetical protein